MYDDIAFSSPFSCKLDEVYTSKWRKCFLKTKKQKYKNQLSFSKNNESLLYQITIFPHSLVRDSIWNALEKIIISLILQRIRYSGGVNEYGECHGMGSRILSHYTSPASRSSWTIWEPNKP